MTRPSHATADLPSRRSHYNSALGAIVSLVALFIIAIRWYHPGRMIGEIDLFPDFHPLTILSKTIFAWSDATSPFGSFDLPTFTFYYLAQAVLGAAFGQGLGQVIMLWLPLALGWLGCFALARSLSMGRSAAFVAAWVYLLNPYIQFVVPWITGSAFFAALPWVFWLIHEAKVHPSIRPRLTAMVTTMSFFGLPWVASTPQLFFELVLVAVSWWIFLSLKSTPGFKSWTLKSLFYSFVAASWWLLTEFVALFSSKIGHATTSADVAWSFAYSSFTNNLRFINVWTWLQPKYISYASSYDANIFTYAAGFFGVVVIILALRKEALVRHPITHFFVGLFIVGIFIAKGPHAPFGMLNDFLYHIPGFFLLIEAAGLTMAALLAVAIVAGLYMDSLGAFPHVGNPRLSLRQLGFLILTATAALLSSSPVLSGQIFSTRSHGPGLHPYVSLPSYWQSAARYINTSKASGDILVLPSDGSYQAVYSWGYEGVDLIPAMVFKRRTFMLGPSLDYLVNPRVEQIKHFLDKMVAVKSSAFVTSLAHLGIRFIICRTDVQTVSAISPCPLTFLGKQVSTRQFGKLTIYRLPVSSPRFILYRTYLDGVYPSDLSVGTLLDARARLGNIPRLSEGENAKGPYSKEHLAMCGHSCPKNPAYSAVFRDDTSTGSLWLKTSSLLTLSFDSPPAVRTILFSDRFHQTQATRYRSVPLFSIISVTHAYDGNQVYAMNPTSHTAKTDFTITTPTNSSRSGMCVTITVTSPYVIARPQEYSRRCDSSQSTSLIFKNISLSPGVSQINIKVSANILNASDFSFRFAGNRSSDVLIAPGGPTTFSHNLSSLSMPGLVTDIPVNSNTKVLTGQSQPRQYLYSGLLYNFFIAGTSYSCYSSIRPYLNVARVLHHCLELNDVHRRVNHAILRRVDYVITLAAHVLSPISAFASPPWLRVTSSAPPLMIVSATRAWSMRKHIPAGTRAVVSIKLNAQPGLRYFATIRSLCGNRRSISRFSTNVVAHSAPVDALLPEPGPMCRHHAVIEVESSVVRELGKALIRPPTIAVMIPSDRALICVGGKIVSQKVTLGSLLRLRVRPSQTVRLLSGSVSPSLMALTSGRPPNPVVESSTVKNLIAGSYLIGASHDSRSNLLVANIAFSPSWLALSLEPRISLLTHERVNGWQNGWSANGSSIILIFNIVNYLEVMLAIAGIVLVGTGWIKRA
uniref:Alpha-(1->3)-arabinofuranosyltransferase N-terminal GT-C domain-containing protein n=1 Tax=mine drainage metagenome TaxID=410659 RepID=E6Q724_9ZZZZ